MRSDMNRHSKPNSGYRSTLVVEYHGQHAAGAGTSGLAVYGTQSLLVLITAVVLAIFCTSCTTAKFDPSLTSYRIEDYGRFEVKPSIICAQSPVTVDWNIKAARYEEIDLGPIGVTLERRELQVLVFMASEPPNLLLPRVPIEENTGSRTLDINEDAKFTLVTGIEGIGFSVPATREVTFLQADAPAERRVEVFPWSCAIDSWAPKNFPLGVHASDDVKVFRIDNINSYPIVLRVSRGTDLPIQRTLLAGECSMEFNGTYSGKWDAWPENIADLGEYHCLPTERIDNNTVFGGGGAQPTLDTEPPPDILVQVTFGCDSNTWERCIPDPP